jgi:predicted ATP-grasp superfamily ATP-dependent carboligase/thioredoxin reductase
VGGLGVPFFGVHEEPLAPAAQSRYLCGRFFWRPGVGDQGAEDTERLLAGLLRLAERIGRRSVLITTDDAGAIFLAEHGAALRPWFLFPDPPAELPRLLAGKYTLHRLCEDLAVPCVAATMPGSLSEARDFADRVGFPLVAKLAMPWLTHPGPAKKSTSMLHTGRDLEHAYRSCAEQGGTGLMLQEYIPRCPEQDFFFHAYCDARSRCRPGFVGVKERSYPPHAGLTSLGRWVHDERLHEQAAALVARIGFQGIADLDYRWDPRDGRFKLLDFNPRLGAQFRLFQDSSGLDVVVAAHLDLTGRPIPDPAPRTGRSFLVENYDPIAAFGYCRRGELGVSSWLASLRRIDEMAWFARDDLAPFGLMCLRMGWRAVTRRMPQRPPHAATGAPPRYRAGRAAARPTTSRQRAHRCATRDVGAPEREGIHMNDPIVTGPATGPGTDPVKDPVDVAIVGAGPYGLSLGAHLRVAGISFRQFGKPMQLWRESMPRGMFLKSQGFASNLSEPSGRFTLSTFCAASGLDYADYGLPVPLDTFVAYGSWFQRKLVPELEEVMVTDVTRTGEYYELTLSDGGRARARNVVVATGVQHFAHMPNLLATLPARMCTHASAHPDLGVFRDADVAVVGAGQSALETAALLHEQGAAVRLLARAGELVWNGDLLAAQRSVVRRVREPEAPLGSGWGTWFYSTQPNLFRLLPRAQRVHRARTALGPAGAAWLRTRVEGTIPTYLRHSVRWAEPDTAGVRLGLQDDSWGIKEIAVDHVIAATGYRPALSRLSFLDPMIRASVQTVAATPDVGPDFQSSVPGLYFVGPSVAPTFGPVMRFVYGADFAVRAVTRALTASRNPRSVAGARK